MSQICYYFHVIMDLHFIQTISLIYIYRSSEQAISSFVTMFSKISVIIPLFVENFHVSEVICRNLSACGKELSELNYIIKMEMGWVFFMTHHRKIIVYCLFLDHATVKQKEVAVRLSFYVPL